jgi:ribose 5-phosphate isomerase B
MENREEIRIAIGSDHAGFELKQKIIGFLNDKKFTAVDFGCKSKESVDYPDYAIKVAKAVYDGEALKGILICGTGSGMSIVANKVKFIRAANCLSKEMAELAVGHNNINVLCLGARLIGEDLAKEIVDSFLSAKFESGRHIGRIEKIHNYTGI